MSNNKHPVTKQPEISYEQDIAVIGMACNFAGAPDLEKFWQQSRQGTAAFSEVARERWPKEVFYDPDAREADKTYAYHGGFLKDIQSFPALAYKIPPRRLEVMDPEQRLSLELALAALDDAGLNKTELPKNTGVFMGVNTGEYRLLLSSRILVDYMNAGYLGKEPPDLQTKQLLKETVARVVPPRPYTAPGILPNMCASIIANELDLHGPAYTLDTACASALTALAEATHKLRYGLLDMAIVGGVYVCLTPECYIAFSRLGALSKQGLCLPFEATGDGFLPGEGGGVVILKRKSAAERDGDQIYALIKGLAINNDGYSPGGPMSPSLRGQQACIKAAWQDAGVSPKYLRYLETHGIGTKAGDLTEIQALKTTLGELAEHTALSSSKANIGHTMSAAAIAGFINATLTLKHREIPPLANFKTPREELALENSPFYINTTSEKLSQVPDSTPLLAAVSSFAFGGTNVHAILESAPPSPTSPQRAKKISAPLPRENYWAVKKSAPVTNAPKTPYLTDPLAEFILASIAKVSAYPVSFLKPTMHLQDDLNFDSLMLAELFKLLEQVKKEGVDLQSLNPCQKLETIAHLLEFAQEHLNPEKITSSLRGVNELREAAAEPEKENSVDVQDLTTWKEVQDFLERRSWLAEHGLKNPYFRVHQGIAADTCLIDNQEYLNFSSYNYLGLSGDPRVIAKAQAGMAKYGTSVSASRVASGERPFHHELEALLARCQDVDDALLFTAGHATNVTAISHLLGHKDLILHDALVHNSIFKGMELSGAARVSFRHDDPEHLRGHLQKIRKFYQKALIVVEGVYSMDGDICKLPAYIALKKEFNCLLMVDEAHSFGVIGKTGQGLREHFQIPGREVDIWMGTLSKSLASCGGWLAGSKLLIEYLRYTAPGFVYSAGLTAANGISALTALECMLQEPERPQKLQHNAHFFCNALLAHGIDVGPAKGGSGVIPAITGSSITALLLSEALFKEHINVQPIIYPAVPDNTARLRFFLSSTHSEAQLQHTADMTAKLLQQIQHNLTTNAGVATT